MLIAVGAILKFAVTDEISGVELSTIGLILMIVGIIGLLISLLFTANAFGRRDTVVREQRYVDDRPPV